MPKQSKTVLSFHLECTPADLETYSMPLSIGVKLEACLCRCMKVSRVFVSGSSG